MYENPTKKPAFPVKAWIRFPHSAEPVNGEVFPDSQGSGREVAGLPGDVLDMGAELSGDPQRRK